MYMHWKLISQHNQYLFYHFYSPLFSTDNLLLRPNFMCHNDMSLTDTFCMFYPGDLFLRSQIILQNVPWNNGDWSNATLVRNFLVFLWLLANVFMTFRLKITECSYCIFAEVEGKITKIRSFSLYNNFPSCPFVRKVQSACTGGYRDGC